MINWIKSLLGYSIHIRWEGKKYVHYSWTRREAYEWMKCYPIEARVWISHSLDSVMIAMRDFIYETQ